MFLHHGNNRLFSVNVYYGSHFVLLLLLNAELGSEFELGAFVVLFPVRLILRDIG